ncbi:MAG TPA: transglutaminase-like domain-containing protein [Gemmatimonadales bacterium]|nr:transglutaminase-like domain-containing protein [Gemmatimonadales bacterium]
MTRRRWAVAILAVWVISLGWLVKREMFQTTGARLAAAALAVPPGALYYRLTVGSQQVGYSSTTIDTLPDALRVVTIYVLDIPALGKMHRTASRSTAMVSRALRLQSVDARFDGDLGQFETHGRVTGDSILQVTIVSGTDSETTRVPMAGPFTLPALLPLRLAFGGELKSGRSYAARLFDPLLVTGRSVTALVSAESTLVVSDSADLDSTTMTWVPEHFDTVRAFRIDHDANGAGVPTRSWIDAQGRLVLASTDPGFSTERAAFEIVYENFKHRDTMRLARSSSAPQPGDIIPLTALAAGVTHVPPARARLLLRLNGRDTVAIVQASASQTNAAYRLPSRDTALARWLAPEPLIQSHDLRIIAQGRRIIQGERDPARVAALLTHWVHGTLRRAPLGSGAPSAERTLESGRGDCNGAATLFVALARSTGLPARTVAGLIYLDGRFYYHAWAEVFLGSWVAVDPTFDQFPADASRLRIATGGLARQAELLPLIGRLKLEVL